MSTGNILARDLKRGDVIKLNGGQSVTVSDEVRKCPKDPETWIVPTVGELGYIRAHCTLKFTIE